MVKVDVIKTMVGMGLMGLAALARADIPIQSGGYACVSGGSLVVASGGELSSMVGVGVKMKLRQEHAVGMKALEGKKIEVLGEPRKEADGSWSFSPMSSAIALKVMGDCK